MEGVQQNHSVDEKGQHMSNEPNHHHLTSFGLSGRLLTWGLNDRLTSRLISGVAGGAAGGVIVGLAGCAVALVDLGCDGDDEVEGEIEDHKSPGPVSVSIHDEAPVLRCVDSLQDQRDQADHEHKQVAGKQNCNQLLG